MKARLGARCPSSTRSLSSKGSLASGGRHDRRVRCASQQSQPVGRNQQCAPLVPHHGERQRNADVRATTTSIAIHARLK
jgi:hypothetical protein